MIYRILRFLGLCIRHWYTENASVVGQIQDFLFLHRVTKMSPLEYHQYKLWDRRIPIEERLAYVSYLEHWEIEPATNPRVLAPLLKDKKLTIARLMSAGIRVPKTLGYIETKDIAKNNQGQQVIFNQLSQIVGEGLPTGLAVKCTEGWSGSGVHIFTSATPEGFSRMDGSFIAMNDLARQLNDPAIACWIIEERLLPHPALARLAPDVISSIRVLTFRSPEGEIHIGPMALKIAVGTKGVDNFRQGNMAAAIDPVTGRLGRGVYFDVDDDNVVTHPTTGVRLEDVTVPYIEEVKQLVTAAAKEIHELATIGWDVAIISDGPIIIEGNVWWSSRLVQMPHNRGLVHGKFAELLEQYKLGDLVHRRKQAAIEWNQKYKQLKTESVS